VWDFFGELLISVVQLTFLLNKTKGITELDSNAGQNSNHVKKPLGERYMEK